MAQYARVQSVSCLCAIAGKDLSRTTMMIMAPEKTPADPSPAIALPMIKAFELGAAPHIAEPTSKRPMEATKIHFGE